MSEAWNRRRALRGLAVAATTVAVPALAADGAASAPAASASAPRRRRRRRRVRRAANAASGASAPQMQAVQRASGPSANASAPARTAAPAVSRVGEEILVGQCTTLSGPVGKLLSAVNSGQEIALDELKRKGNINGRPVRLITLDDQFDGKKGAEVTTTLIERDKVVAMYGFGSTQVTMSSLPILLEKKIPGICSYSGSPVLRKFHPYFFTTMASYRDEVVQMMRNLIALQRGSVGVCFQNAPFGQLMKPVLEEVAKSMNVQIVAQSTIESDGKDAIEAVQKLAVGKPQAVILMGFGLTLPPFVKAVHSYLGVPIYCMSLANNSAVFDSLGDEARGVAVTQLVPYPGMQISPITREFAASCQRMGKEPTYDLMFGYLNMRILFEALRRAGDVTPANIVKAMEGMTKFDLGGYPLSYSPTNHNGSHFIEITVRGPGGRWIK